jgi:hypothetical protein
MSMADEPEFRIGDVQTAIGGTRRSSTPGVGALDAQVFPTLAALLGAPDFRKQLDALASQAREEAAPEVQAALQTAVRLLPILQSKYGG